MRPNDFIINTNYATLKNDAKGKISITIPDSFTVNVNTAPLSATLNLGERSAGMHFVFTSTKYPNLGLVSSQILIPCKSTYTSSVDGRVTRDNLLNCYVYRSSANTVKMEIAPNIPGDITSSEMTITGAAQTVTCNISTLINPFEA